MYETMTAPAKSEETLRADERAAERNVREYETLLAQAEAENDAIRIEALNAHLAVLRADSLAVRQASQTGIEEWRRYRAQLEADRRRQEEGVI